MDNAMKTDPDYVSSDLDGEHMLWIRRQLFEHSFTVPLTAAAIGEILDQSSTIQELAKLVQVDPETKIPWVTYENFEKVVVNKNEEIIQDVVRYLVEVLILNTRDTLTVLNPGQSLRTRILPGSFRIPLPELFIFIRLAQRAKTLAVTSREAANSVWPEERPNFSPLGTPNSKQPSSPFASEPVSPISTKNTQSSASPLMKSVSVKSTVVQDVQRETNTVVDAMEELVKSVALSYGMDPQDPQTTIAAYQLEHLGMVLFSKSGSIASALPEFRQQQHDNNMITDDVERRISIRQAVHSLKSAISLPVPDSKSIHEDEYPDLLHIHDFDRVTIIREGTKASPLFKRDVRISNGNESYIYLLQTLGRVSVVGCGDCTLFIGGAESVSVIGCGRVDVIAIAHRFRVTNAFDCNFYLCTNREPLLVGDARGVHLAPYNASYIHFEREIRQLDINPAKNMWNEPKVLSPFTTKSGSSANKVLTFDATTSLFLPPEKFLPFIVPVAGEKGMSKEELGPPQAALPLEYIAALSAKSRDVDQLRKLVRQSHNENIEKKAQNNEDESMSDSTKSNDLQLIVQEHFRDWLMVTGNMRQIHDLIRLEQEFNSNLK